MEELQHLRGKMVVRIRRIYHVHHGRVATQEGALELRFQDNTFLLLDTRSGWTLCIAQEEWSDPFAHPLTGEESEFTREHVREYGTWSAFDISHRTPACYVLGRTVTAFREIRDEVDELKEAVLEFGEFIIKAYSYGGEVRVEWNSPDFIGCDFPYLLPSE